MLTKNLMTMSNRVSTKIATYVIAIHNHVNCNISINTLSSNTITNSKRTICIHENTATTTTTTTLPEYK